ncbi:hypothetical protein EVAR_54483_1 [Eumeta japonica]|uniref:Uncharacterized protein n=1 Tax=Eumeta variegata TaxID=151549 RepID=A0A4C1YVW8_EUMVA|nr:hypothetical protein EVAR_54483_1 [Eumeta japonica]
MEVDALQRYLLASYKKVDNEKPPRRKKVLLSGFEILMVWLCLLCAGTTPRCRTPPRPSLEVPASDRGRCRHSAIGDGRYADYTPIAGGQSRRRTLDPAMTRRLPPLCMHSPRNLLADSFKAAFAKLEWFTEIKE